MSKVIFTEGDEEYWFDPKEAEYSYDGENNSLLATLENIESMAFSKTTDDMEGEATNFTPEARTYNPQKARDIIEEFIEDEGNITLKKGPQVIDRNQGKPGVVETRVVKRISVDDIGDVPNSRVFGKDWYDDYYYLEGLSIAKESVPEEADHISPDEDVPEGYVEFTGPRGGTYAISPDNLADELGEDVSVEDIEQELRDREGGGSEERDRNEQVQSDAASDKIPVEDREVPDGVSGPIEEWNPDDVEGIVSPNMRFAEIGSEAHPLFYRRPEPDEIDEYVESVRSEEQWQEGKKSFDEGFVGGDNTKNDYVDEDGNWDEERLEKHDEWTDDLVNPDAEVPEGEQPTGMLVLGPPGAGKGWWQEQVEDGEYGDDFGGKDFTHVNSDETKEPIPEYDGTNSSVVHDEASKMAKEDLAEKSIGRNHNVMLDKVATTPGSTIEMMNKMKDNGYDLRATFVDVPEDKAAHNAVSRFYQEGRFTPFDYLLEGGPDEGDTARDGSRKTFETVIEELDIDEDKVGEFSNDVEWGNAPDAEQVGEELLKTFYEWLGFDLANKYSRQVSR